MRHLLILLCVLGLALAACDNNEPAPAQGNQTPASQFGPFEWDRNPDTIIVRIDSQPNQEPPAYRMNSIPPCTVWGDGRVVWTVSDGSGSEQVLEARIDEATMRAFLESIFGRGFYTWEEEFIPPNAIDPIIESITVNLYNEVRTVQRFSAWPQNAYFEILDDCRHLSDTPVLVMPKAGWVSAWAIPRDTQAPTWFWPLNAPVSLKELAEKGEAHWLEGDLVTEIWLNARQSRDDIQVIEVDQAYQVAVTVPGYSRDAPPPPDTGQ